MCSHRVANLGVAGAAPTSSAPFPGCHHLLHSLGLARAWCGEVTSSRGAPACVYSGCGYPPSPPHILSLLDTYRLPGNLLTISSLCLHLASSPRPGVGGRNLWLFWHHSLHAGELVRHWQRELIVSRFLSSLLVSSKGCRRVVFFLVWPE